MKVRNSLGVIIGDTGTTPAKDNASRKWLLTINNPQSPCKVTGLNGEEIGSVIFRHEDIKLIIANMERQPVYWCMVDEKAPTTGTYHTHIFLYYKAAMRFSTLKTWFYSADMECCKGTCAQNRAYLLKEGKHADKSESTVEGTFEEFGEVPIERQGQRTDLQDIFDMVKSGAGDYEILEMFPNAMLYLDKIERVRQVYIGSQYSNIVRQVEGLYIYGPPGTGKSTYVWNTYGSNAYRVSDYQHPFDRYKGQPVIWLEEFDGAMMPYYQLKMLFDGFPDSLPARYSNKEACYTKIICTTNRPLEKQYIGLQMDSPYDFQAILRRFQQVWIFKKNGEISKQSMYEYMGCSPTFKSLPKDFLTPFDKKEDSDG